MEVFSSVQGEGPHVGTSTVQTRVTMARMTLANLLAGLAGEPLPNPVPA